MFLVSFSAGWILNWVGSQHMPLLSVSTPKRRNFYFLSLSDRTDKELRTRAVSTAIFFITAQDAMLLGCQWQKCCFALQSLAGKPTSKAKAWNVHQCVSFVLYTKHPKYPGEGYVRVNERGV